MKNFKNLITLCCSFAIFPIAISTANAAVISSGKTTITKIVSYTGAVDTDNSTRGDMLILTVTAPAGCTSGFWLHPSNVGYNNTLSVLLSAFHTKSTVSINADDTKLLPDTGGKFCRIDSVELY